ncbi:MAG: aminodeoxychorismate synthase component I [Panacagrimonas sp.]
MNLRAEVSGAVDLLAVHRKQPLRFPFLLQSAAEHALSGRFDILLGFPGERLEGAAGLARLAAEAAVPSSEQDPLLPYLGGWFLYLGYEAANYFEPSLRLPRSPFRLPDFLAVRCPAAMIYDRIEQRTTLVAESDASQIDAMRDVLRSLSDEDGGAESMKTSLVDGLSEDPPDRFLASVDRILDYLRAGDTFQVNLSRAWRACLRKGTDHTAVYAQLRRANPAPFAGLALIDGVAVLSSSPERLVQRDGDRVQTRPSAGTRPRGPGDEDARLRAQLIGSLKERAEHVMLIDLERNDLGRVCVPGSIEVSELMTLESYAHVHHIVSNVRGRLRPGTGPVDVLAAVFPGGTITGCPKVRAMQIIAELEGVGRGPYTGSMGYLSNCGRMDTSILIRTLVVQDGEVHLRAGAGIVADSLAPAELAETRAKARGLLLALEAAA